MPRRNAAAVRTTRRNATTHVVIDTAFRNSQVYFGTKSECNHAAERANSDAGSWRYHVKPIHK